MSKQQDDNWGLVVGSMCVGAFLGTVACLITQECMKTHEAKVAREVAQQEELVDRITRVERNIELSETEAVCIYKKICRMQKTEDTLDERVKALEERARKIEYRYTPPNWTDGTNCIYSSVTSTITLFPPVNGIGE